MKNDRPSFFELNTKHLLKLNPFDLLPASAHKYQRGHVLVIGGSSGKFGAPVLTALAAYRTGSGWVSLALPEKTSLGKTPIECTLESFFFGGTLKAKSLEKFLNKRNVACVAIGPGTMKSPLRNDVLKVLFNYVEDNGRLVIDAAATAGWLDQKARKPWPVDRVVLTPHPGEWAKLKKSGFKAPHSPKEVKSVQKFLKTFGATWIFKSAAPLIIQPDRKECFMSTAGSNALAKAGSGDLLTGIIAAHLAVGCKADFAAARSLAVLTDAAKQVVKARGQHGLIATDLIDYL